MPADLVFVLLFIFFLFIFLFILFLIIILVLLTILVRTARWTRRLDDGSAAPGPPPCLRPQRAREVSRPCQPSLSIGSSRSSKKARSGSERRTWMAS